MYVQCVDMRQGLERSYTPLWFKYSTFFTRKQKLRIQPISSTFSCSPSPPLSAAQRGSANQFRTAVTKKAELRLRLARSAITKRREGGAACYASCYLLFPARVQFEQLALKRFGLSVCLPPLAIRPPVNFLRTSVGALFFSASRAAVLHRRMYLKQRG